MSRIRRLARLLALALAWPLAPLWPWIKAAVAWLAELGRGESYRANGNILVGCESVTIHTQGRVNLSEGASNAMDSNQSISTGTPSPRRMTGARPTPRHKLAAARPYQITGPTPPQMVRIPAKLSYWLNDQYGDCVTAEEA